MRILALALALAALPLTSCSRDCETLCQKQRGCQGLTDKTGFDNCVQNCQLLVQEQNSAERLSNCVACLDGKSCEALFPADPTVGGACDNVCSH